MLIRQLQCSDVRSLVILLKEQFEAPESQMFERRILKCLESMRANSLTILAAFEHNEVVGYIIIQWLHELWTDTYESFISNLYVCQNQRRKGIGTDLVSAAIEEAKKRNCARLFLENSRNSSIYQDRFYEKRGWKERHDISIMEFPRVGNNE